jgi:hypothetical protein
VIVKSCFFNQYCRLLKWTTNYLNFDSFWYFFKNIIILVLNSCFKLIWSPSFISLRQQQIILFIGLFKLLFSSTITKYCRSAFDPFGHRQFFLNEQQIISILTSFKLFFNFDSHDDDDTDWSHKTTQRQSFMIADKKWGGRFWFENLMDKSYLGPML